MPTAPARGSDRIPDSAFSFQPARIRSRLVSTIAAPVSLGRSTRSSGRQQGLPALRERGRGHHALSKGERQVRRGETAAARSGMDCASRSLCARHSGAAGLSGDRRKRRDRPCGFSRRRHLHRTCPGLSPAGRRSNEGRAFPGLLHGRLQHGGACDPAGARRRRRTCKACPAGRRAFSPLARVPSCKTEGYARKSARPAAIRLIRPGERRLSGRHWPKTSSRLAAADRASPWAAAAAAFPR
jgi:hypothetical protein